MKFGNFNRSNFAVTTVEVFVLIQTNPNIEKNDCYIIVSSVPTLALVRVLKNGL